MSALTLIESLPPDGGPVTLGEAAASRWMQGRTLYGGASAMIAYCAARAAFPALPPLRGAQVAFVAPLGAAFEVRRAMVRQGRNVAVVRSELWSDGGCALTATWLFGATRAANAVHPAAPPARPPAPPEECPPAEAAFAPAFIAGNFDVRRAAPAPDTASSAAPPAPRTPVLRRWARLVEGGGVDPVAALILMGDVLPPGAIKAMQRPAPLSSMNWSFNLLAETPQTRDGWWLAETASQHADAGYSSERLRLWNTAGEQVLDGMQCAAIFG